jgi:putative DNA primase/helicase
MDSHPIDLRALAIALGGEVACGQVLCPGPNHSKADRSLAVKPVASGGFVVHSFAGDDWRECRSRVYARLGLPQWRSHNLVIAWTEASKSESNKNVENARRIWGEGTDPRGTRAEDYLDARKLHLPTALCGPVLRFHPLCPWRSDDKVEFIPCLIAAFTAVTDNAITAIHRIRVDKPERWPKTDRKMLGSVRGAAVKLDPPSRR